jgi:hypothetical protein
MRLRRPRLLSYPSAISLEAGNTIKVSFIHPLQTKKADVEIGGEVEFRYLCHERGLILYELSRKTLVSLVHLVFNVALLRQSFFVAPPETSCITLFAGHSRLSSSLPLPIISLSWPPVRRSQQGAR